MSEKRIPEALPVQYRAYALRAEQSGEGAAVPLSFSSDRPVQRQYYGGLWWNEVLGHDKGEVRTERLQQGLTLLVEHDPKLRAGRLENGEIRAGEGRGEAYFGTTEFARTTKQEVDDKTLRYVSVGYIVHQMERVQDADPADDEDEDYLGTYRVSDWEPVEVSLVSVPADPSVGVRRAVDGLPQYPVRGLRAPKLPNPAPAETTEVRKMEPNTAPAENAAEIALRNLEELDVVHASYPEIFTAAKRTEFARAKRTPDEARKFVLEEMGKRSASSSVSPAASPAAAVTADELDRRDKTVVLGGCIRAFAAVKGRSVREAVQYAQTVFKDGAVVRALSASTAQDGGFTVTEDVLPGVLELLRPKAVVRSLGATTIPMPNGNLTQNRLTSGTGFQYIGENKPAPVTSAKGGQMKLSAKKGAALLPISNDLIRFGGNSFDVAVRNDLVRAVAQGEDIAFIRNNGTAYSPRGLRWLANAVNVIAANATVNLQNVTNDIGKLWLALRRANIQFTNPGFIFSPRTEYYLMNLRDSIGNFVFRAEMMTGKLFNYPYRVTTQIPENLTDGTQSEVYFVDFGEVVIGETMAMTFDISQEASYVDGSGTTVSAFQNDQTLVRVLVEHDINVNYDTAIAVLTGVTWGYGT